MQLVDSLGIQYRAESQGRFKSKDFYGIISWQVLTTQPDSIPDIRFTLIPNASGDGFKFISGKVQGNAKWSTPFFINQNSIIVHKLKSIAGSSPVFCYNKNKVNSAFELSSSVRITTSKESNVIQVSYSDMSSDRAVDVLKGLVKLHNQQMGVDKSKGYSQAIDFIESRMEPLRRELDSIETSLAAFKSSRGISGSSSNGDLYLQRMQGYDNELTKINIMETTINSVESFMKNPKLKDADLSFVGVDNPGLQNVLSQYQKMRQEREKLALTAQESNPALQLIDKNLSDLRSNMEAQLSSYKRNLNIAKDAYQQKISGAESLLKSSPIAEKELMDKTRFQNIKEQLYLTLLQKREEAAIAKASVTVNTKVLYPPIAGNATVKPSKASILVTGLIIGLLLPIIFAVVKEIFNKKIISKRQLQNITNIPVLAEVEQVSNVENFPLVIGAGSRSMFGEQVRTMRTNINFYINAEKKTNYLVITSSVSGEGKSFLSMNLAKSYSMQGKKVALLEFDLRRPKIAKALNFNVKHGLSALLVGKVKPEDIVMPIVRDDKEHFDLFPTGTIPPNPQELLSAKYMDELKTYLESHYDIVVIDTPPFGIVADAQILGKWADLSLIVTRFNQTVKEQIYEINDWNERKLFPSMAIIFNGVKNSGYFGYKYGYYYYKRKYGYGYYSGYVSGSSSQKEESET
jgi:capsular exopolysaccharide synthesis family protein